jgi:hypothetical protein
MEHIIAAASTEVPFAPFRARKNRDRLSKEKSIVGVGSALRGAQMGERHV